MHRALDRMGVRRHEGHPQAGRSDPGQPYANHNGGRLAFGPDGLLNIALGDGGSGGDPPPAAPVDELTKGAKVGQVEQLSSFGEGLDGELYALSRQGPVCRIDPA
ncbi:PQQ-dependent sugar dehydrogenase [Nonomuraea aurantiaca]|uniref:PQQ-dependent sugar dehydrogenase n=1 Tax=Nonomuraea aurantiaca TaxID=2878562 RepID=UPI001CD9A292|nr:PQQ-dependent sugar dehydrogenase [Nonomuraea aurantiaca]MCA2220396.1 PQQ-dependent sugar dehydrogenase [Nonomuraea aurantiaca]